MSDVVVPVSRQAKEDLAKIKENEGHQTFDSVIRTLLMERKMYKMAVNAIK